MQSLVGLSRGYVVWVANRARVRGSTSLRSRLRSSQRNVIYQQSRLIIKLHQLIDFLRHVFRDLLLHKNRGYGLFGK